MPQLPPVSPDEGPPPCPKCGHAAHATESVSKRSWTRRCLSCWQRSVEWLPEREKKFVYLDQMVVSNIAKALDPVWRQQRVREHGFWLELFDQLERLVKLQLVACPESPIHERESSVSPYAEPMRHLYEHLAAGIKFHLPQQVLATQLHHARRALSAGKRVDYRDIDRRRMHHGSATDWMDRVRISVRFPDRDGVIDERRIARERAGAALTELWEVWRAHREVTFAERYAIERRGATPVMWSRYTEWYAAMLDYMTGRRDLDDAIIDPLGDVTTAQGIVAAFRDETDDALVALRRAFEFLRSEVALDAPQNDIGALLMAALARRAANGQKHVPSPGTWNDITAIATYLPYCDAMFVDNQFASLLAEQPLKARLAPFATRIFSYRTRNDFLQFLQEVEMSASEQHKAHIVAVYGDGWLTPYRAMLEDRRSREER